MLIKQYILIANDVIAKSRQRNGFLGTLLILENYVFSTKSEIL